MDKKGQVTDIKSIIGIALIAGIILAVTGIILAFVAQINSDVQISVASTETVNIVNETNSTNILSLTAFLLRNNPTNTRGFSLDTSTLTVINASVDCHLGVVGCEDVAVGNFTISSNGTIEPVSDTAYNETALNFTYTYSRTDLSSQFNVTQKSNEGLTNLTDQFGSIGTIAGAIILIGMVLVIARFTNVF